MVFARKSVKQRFDPDQRTLQLMDLFRRMTNDCVRIGLEEGRTSLKSLSLSCYRKLNTYNVSYAYKLCAISKAAGILGHCRRLSKRRHVKQPYCVRPNLTTCYGLKVRYGRLRMPGGLEVALNSYTLRFLSQSGVEARSVTLTPESVSISVRRQVQPMACAGMLGLDRNLNNVSLVDTETRVEKHDLSSATAIKTRCRRIRGHFARNE
jgi:putative transposase